MKKRCQRVTEDNLPTILGYVQKLLSGRNFVEITIMNQSYTLKRVNQLFNGNNLSVQILLLEVSIVYWARIERTFLFPKPFISISSVGRKLIIDIDDQVKIAGHQMILFKGKYSENKNSKVEVFDFK